MHLVNSGTVQRHRQWLLKSSETRPNSLRQILAIGVRHVSFQVVTLRDIPRYTLTSAQILHCNTLWHCGNRAPPPPVPRVAVASGACELNLVAVATVMGELDVGVATVPLANTVPLLISTCGAGAGAGSAKEVGLTAKKREVVMRHQRILK